MYAALWRSMPGPWWVRTAIVLILLAAALYLLFWYVFPWVAANTIPDDGTITESAGALIRSLV